MDRRGFIKSTLATCAISATGAVAGVAGYRAGQIEKQLPLLVINGDVIGIIKSIGTGYSGNSCHPIFPYDTIFEICQPYSINITTGHGGIYEARLEGCTFRGKGIVTSIQMHPEFAEISLATVGATEMIIERK